MRERLQPPSHGEPPPSSSSGGAAGRGSLTAGMTAGAPAEARIGGLLGEPATGAGGGAGGGAATAGGDADDPFGLHLGAATIAAPAAALAQAATLDGEAAPGAAGAALGVAGAPVVRGPAARAVLGDLGVRGAAAGGRAFVADDDPRVLAHELAHVAQGAGASSAAGEAAADAAAGAAVGGEVAIPEELTGLPAGGSGAGGSGAGGADAGGGAAAGAGPGGDDEIAAYGGRIQGTGVRLRSSPDTSRDDNIVTYLTPGATVEVLDDSDPAWRRVRVGSQEGWVHASFVIRTDAPAQGISASGNAGTGATPGGTATPGSGSTATPGAATTPRTSTGAPTPAAQRAASQPRVPIDAAPVSSQFLGVSISAHPTLAWRLARAEAHLESQLGVSGGALRARLQVDRGYSVHRNRDAYHHFSLAIDINYNSNPYVGGQGGRDAGADREALAAIWRACLLVGSGEALSPSTSWSRGRARGSTEALYDHFAASNQALERYLGARDNPTQIQQWIDAGNLRRDVAPPREVPAAALRADELRQADAAAWQRQAQADFETTHGARATGSNWWRTGASQRSALGFMNLDRDLVIALRDVGGLAWGASDFGAGANGDFMHFDCRHDYSRDQLRAAMAAPTPAPTSTP